jgi:hypothetical protein
VVNYRKFWQDIECKFLKTWKIRFWSMKMVISCRVNTVHGWIHLKILCNVTDSFQDYHKLFLLALYPKSMLSLSLPQVLISWLYSATLFIRCSTRLASRGGRSLLCRSKSITWCTPKFFVSVKGHWMAHFPLLPILWFNLWAPSNCCVTSSIFRLRILKMFIEFNILVTCLKPMLKHF